MQQRKKIKSKPLVQKGNPTSLDIIMKVGNKRKYIMHLQRHSKNEKPLDAEIINLQPNKDKIVFYQTEPDDMMFTQLSCYAQKPFQFMIVNGERNIIMPFDKAFALKEGLTKYLELVKSMQKSYM